MGSLWGLARAVLVWTMTAVLAAGCASMRPRPADFVAAKTLPATALRSERAPVVSVRLLEGEALMAWLREPPPPHPEDKITAADVAMVPVFIVYSCGFMGACLVVPFIVLAEEQIAASKAKRELAEKTAAAASSVALIPQAAQRLAALTEPLPAELTRALQSRLDAAIDPDLRLDLTLATWLQGTEPGQACISLRVRAVLSRGGSQLWHQDLRLESVAPSVDSPASQVRCARAEGLLEDDAALMRQTMADYAAAVPLMLATRLPGLPWRSPAP